MSEEKFTPGPWKITKGDDYHGDYVESWTGETVCDLYFMSNKKPIRHGANTSDNAHLIAAAPDMYAEIERDIKHLRVRARKAPSELKLRLVCEMDRKIRLLAKARGEYNA